MARTRNRATTKRRAPETTNPEKSRISAASRSSILVTLASLAFGCGDDGVGRQDADIIGGTEHDADPAVVALVLNGGAHCTATVVAPRVLLTAAHCVADWNLGELAALFAPDVHAPSPEAARIGLSTAAVHPAWPGPAADIALLALASDSPAAPVKLLDQTLDSSVVGDTLRVVGYGRTAPAGPLGRKMEGFARILELDETHIAHEPNTCPGDSGGPGFLSLEGADVLAGVHNTGSCGQGAPSRKARVDHHRDFIDGFIEHPPEDGPGPLGDQPLEDEVPTALSEQLTATAGESVRRLVRCKPHHHALSVSLWTDGAKADVYLRIEQPPTPELWDAEFSAPFGVTTESDGFVPAAWHVLVVPTGDIVNAKFELGCV